MTTRTLSIGETSYPLILPNTRDPRLHVAAVIITIHVLGQTVLGFQVSVPQILAAILTTAVIEVALTFRSSRAFVWPASAMLTGSGVALILRVVGTPAHDPWSTYSWYIFAGVAAFSLLTKYIIRYRGSHVFNPSNIGLVVAFVVLGSSVVEPLDFWWAPLTIGMFTAYAVIFAGGMMITRRLKLLALAASFWITMAITLGLLAGSGHCMVANWAFAPVCGFDYWRVIILSPELMIFLFFMITDPKTTPSGQVGRVAFGILVAVTSTLLMAPQTNEFGTKVALLAGLVVMCAARPIFDRALPAPGSAADDLGRFGRRLATGGDTSAGVARGVLRVGLIAVVVLGVGVGIVAAGTPARGIGSPDTAEVLSRVPHQVDPATLPAINVQQEVADWNYEIAGPGMQEVVLSMGENLALENEALLRKDPTILAAVDHGDRLIDMQRRLAEAITTGVTVVPRYRFDTLEVSLLEPFGKQDGLSLAFDASGTITEETYDASGALQGSRTSPFATTFVLRRATGDRWLTVAELPPGAGG